LKSTVETNVRLQKGNSTRSPGAYDLIRSEFGRNGIKTTEALVALNQKLEDQNFKRNLQMALLEQYPVLSTDVFRKLFNDNIFETHGIKNKIKFCSYENIGKLMNGKLNSAILQRFR
jgi:hypothetical protein